LLAGKNRIQHAAFAGSENAEIQAGRTGKIDSRLVSLATPAFLVLSPSNGNKRYLNWLK
jgi:hypothetical protein